MVFYINNTNCYVFVTTEKILLLLITNYDRVGSIIYVNLITSHCFNFLQMTVLPRMLSVLEIVVLKVFSIVTTGPSDVGEESISVCNK